MYEHGIVTSPKSYTDQRGLVVTMSRSMPECRQIDRPISRMVESNPQVAAGEIGSQLTLDAHLESVALGPM